MRVYFIALHNAKVKVLWLFPYCHFNLTSWFPCLVCREVCIGAGIWDQSSLQFGMPSPCLKIGCNWWQLWSLAKACSEFELKLKVPSSSLQIVNRSRITFAVHACCSALPLGSSLRCYRKELRCTTSQIKIINLIHAGKDYASISCIVSRHIWFFVWWVTANKPVPCRKVVIERVRLRELTWGNQDHLDQLSQEFPTGFEVIIGADVVYEGGNVPLLFKAARFLFSKQKKVSCFNSILQLECWTRVCEAVNNTLFMTRSLQFAYIFLDDHSIASKIKILLITIRIKDMYWVWKAFW